MSTTIKTEQRILNLETTSGAVKLNSEVVLSLSSGNIIKESGNDNRFIKRYRNNKEKV